MLDKTGTLTMGKMSVSSAEMAGEWNRQLRGEKTVVDYCRSYGRRK